MGLPVMCEALFLRKLKIFAQARRKCCYPPSPLLSGRLVCHVGPCQKNTDALALLASVCRTGGLA